MHPRSEYGRLLSPPPLLAATAETPVLGLVGFPQQKKHEAETAEVIAFIEGALQRKLPDQHISDVLHNGVVLCELMQVLQPGSIAKVRVVCPRVIGQSSVQ